MAAHIKEKVVEKNDKNVHNKSYNKHTVSQLMN